MNTGARVRGGGATYLCLIRKWNQKSIKTAGDVHMGPLGQGPGIYRLHRPRELLNEAAQVNGRWPPLACDFLYYAAG